MIIKSHTTKRKKQMKKTKPIPLNGKREILSFIEAISKSPRLWKSLDICIAAIKIGRNWHNVYTGITLSNKSIESGYKWKRISVLNNISIWFGALPKSQLNKILQQIRLGELTIDFIDNKINYQKCQNEPINRAVYSNWDIQLASRNPSMQYMLWNEHTLSTYRDPFWHLLQDANLREFEIENALRRNTPPIDGFENLGEILGGKRELIQHTKSAAVNVSAPLKIRIDEVSTVLENGKLSFVLEAGTKYAAEQCDLGITTPGKKMDVAEKAINKNQRLIINPRSWKSVGGELIYEGAFSIPDAESATLLLQLGGYIIHRVTFNAKKDNPKMLAYQLYDRGSEHLLEVLKHPRKGGGFGFDQAVARLFTFLGFGTDILAGNVPKQSDTPDILAYLPEKKIVLVMECTEESIDANGKLGKLYARIHEIESVLSECEILGIAVTAYKRDQIQPADMEKAEKSRIIILGQEDLQKLFTLANAWNPEKEAVRYLREALQVKFS
jgi:hypothetical protein